MAGRGWDKRFDMPIELPDGTTLKTLRDAIKYLAATVPAKERDMPQVKLAADLLTRAAEGSDAWVLLAGMATGQALHRHDVRVFNPDRKDHHWGKRKLKRDE
jgi:hypothetical protein